MELISKISNMLNNSQANPNTNQSISNPNNNLNNNSSYSPISQSIPEVKPIKLPDSRDAGKLAFTYDSVINKTECDFLINLAEKDIGFSKDHTQFYPGRNNSRACRISPKFAESIYQRVKQSLPEFWYSNRIQNADGTKSKWRIMGLNEFVRFYKYDEGDYFKIHKDGAYSRDTVSYRNPVNPEGPAINLKERIGERSFITFIIYMNEGFIGGETTFHAGGFYNRNSKQLKAAEPVKCIPETGKALIFQHDILHEGSKLITGKKYAFRMDVMYSRVHVCEKRGELLPKNYEENPLPILEENGGICLENATD